MADNNPRCLKCGGPVSVGVPPAAPESPPESAGPGPDGAVVLMSTLGAIIGAGLGWITNGFTGAAVGAVIGLVLATLVLSMDGGGVC